jgi:tRNA (guanine-N7-)-methyltransferase
MSSLLLKNNLIRRPPVLFKDPDLRSGAFAEWLHLSKQPIELEIGSSYGEFLCSIAGRNPGRRYVGVEIMGKKAAPALQRAALRGLGNVCILNIEAQYFLEQ